MAPWAVLVALLGIQLLDPDLLEPLRLHVFDAWQRLHPRPADEALHAVLIVDLDEESLRRLGQWPWPRHRVSELVDRIASDSPAAIGFDIIFPEPDGRSPEQILALHPELDGVARERLEALPAHDALLAESLSRAPAVLGMAPVLTTTGPGGPFRHPPVRLAHPELAGALPLFDAIVRSIEPLDAAARGHASLVATPEPDGIVRRLPGAVRVGDAIVPSLAIEMLRVATGAAWFGIEGGRAGLTSLKTGRYTVPTDPDGRIWIPFSPHASWRFVPAHQVLSRDIPPGFFRGRLVIVGTTALGLADLHATPVEPKMHGIEIQAQLLEAILTGVVPRRPAWSLLVELAATALAGGTAILLARRVSRRSSLLAGLIIAAALAGASALAFVSYRLLLAPALPILAAAAAYTVALGGRLTEEQAARRAAEAALRLEQDHTLRLEGEMEAARDLQMGMLPQALPALATRRDFELHGRIIPAKQVGGDLYDYYLLDSRRLFFLIGDVSGKGAPAALFMALTKAACKTAALRGVEDPGMVLREASEAIARESGGRVFVTLFAGLLDLSSGELIWCNAGHDPPLRMTRERSVQRLPLEGGPPLGTVEGYAYASGHGRLEQDECLVLFTDGVTEAMGPDATRFSLKRTISALDRADRSSAEAVVDALCAEVSRFAAGVSQADDITILAIRRAPPGEDGLSEP